MITNQPNIDPPIRVGDIVSVDVSDLSSERKNYVAKIRKITPAEGVDLDTVGGGWTSVAIERCYHATEKQKAKYFMEVLKHGG